MTHRIARPALAAALLLAAAPLRAQPGLPEPGARVRIELVGSRRVVGTLVAREPDRWLVRRGPRDTVAVTPPFIERLDVSRGERSPEEAFLRGARTGALVGGGISLAFGAILLTQVEGDCHDCFVSPVALVGALGAGLTLATTLVAGILGSQQLDRWEPVALPADARLGVIATPHGAGVGVRVALP